MFTYLVVLAILFVVLSVTVKIAEHYNSSKVR